MRQSSCGRGHHYDSSAFISCPHCAGLSGTNYQYEACRRQVPEGGPDTARQSRVFRATLGTAPDGLPWVLDIDRGPLVSELLSTAANELGFSSTEAIKNTRLAQSLQGLLDERDFAAIDIEGERTECYVVNESIPSLIGPTLLERLIVAPGSAPDVTRPVRARTIPLQSKAPSTLGGTPPAQLAIPLNGDLPIVVKRAEDESSSEHFRFVRRFSPESLAGLNTACFRIIPSAMVERPMSDLEAYRNVMLQYMSDDPDLDLRSTAICLVGRAEIIQLLADASTSLEQLHRNGKVHGDLKPSNLLITSDGIKVIDSLNLQPWVPSTSMTPGWAAPEQIMGSAVLPATDQFSFGLLISTLVGGRIRESIPSIVTGPPIYRDGTTIDPTGLQHWLIFLDRCLRWDPAQRYPSMGVLAGDLREVLSRYPPKGQIPIRLSFGEQSYWDGTNKLFGWTVKYWPMYEQGVRVGYIR